MRISKLLSLFAALVTLPLFSQACAQGQAEIIGGSEDGGGGAGSTVQTTTSTGSGDGGDGPCTGAEDCAGLTDACNIGACINGACGKLPANEGTGCDDGLFCTSGTSCQNGVCGGGTTTPCPASNGCVTSTCDKAADACVDVPGNEGASCVDDDPCTISSTCANGVCVPGQLVDCSYLDGTCSVGVCDPQLGCVTQGVNDGTACNDGLYCTINDTCQSGLCTGDVNTCTTPGDVCMIGSCNEGLDTCTAVPGNNGVACDDGNDCTSGSACSNGQCVGGVPANNGAACDDGDGCSTGTTCVNGVCGNANGQIMACINGDGCCPAGCANNADDDCMDLTGVYAQYASDNRNVYIWQTPPCAPLQNYTTFCQDHASRGGRRSPRPTPNSLSRLPTTSINTTRGFRSITR